MRTGNGRLRRNVLTTSEGLRPYIETKLSTKLSPDAQFVGRLRPDGSIWGVVAFDDFSEFDCEIFMAGDKGWVSRALIKAAFHYPFNVMNLLRVSAKVDANDTSTISINQRVGFEIEGRLRSALGDRDMLIMGMLRQDYRWN